MKLHGIKVLGSDIWSAVARNVRPWRDVCCERILWEGGDVGAKKHQEAGDPGKGKEYKYMDHVSIYKQQFGNTDIYDKTTNEYKTALADSYASYLLGAFNEYEISADELSDEINAYNKQHKKDGISISATFSGRGVFLETSGTNNEGRQTKTKSTKAAKDPH